ncbi:MAG: glycosyltransferase [Bacteroidetes bacterium]|nr:glycosyltransferase [Bacteroidota bacterium]
MKVAYIGTAHPLRGGLTHFNERLARTFQQQQHEVLLYTFSLQYPAILFPGKSQFTKSLPPKDLKIQVVINSINPLNWIRVGNRIRKLRPDIVLTKFWIPFMAPCLGTILRIIRKNKHTKAIAIIDNIIPHEKRPGDKALAKYFVNSTDGFVTMSHSVSKDLQLFTHHQPIVYNPHPLYDNFGPVMDKQEAQKALNLDIKTKYILFFGLIRAYKGLDLLLQAFADKRLRNIPVKLIIAGEYYEDSKPYHEIIRKHDLEGLIIHANYFIPDEDVRKYFCASDIIVQPYKNATQSGITQIAYHFNKPMIVTNVGGLPELVPDGKVGYVVDPDPGKIADAMVDYFENNKEAAFSAQVIEEKKKYSWDGMYEKIVDLYEEIK